MKEYYGKKSKIYKQRKINLYLLMPAIKRAIEFCQKTPRSTLLDVACGNGGYHNIVLKEKLEYSGFDISPDMIKKAKEDYPNGKFKLASSTDFAKDYDEKFDLVLINMLLPALETQDMIKKTLIEVKKVLKENGNIIISIGHPCFNHYMQKNIFKRTDVNTDFKGYFQPDIKFKVSQKFDGQEFIFTDYHRSLSNYINNIIDSGFNIVKVDECRPIDAQDEKINSFLEKYNSLPIYFVLICEKKI